jgi:phage/plasmid-like protein (TIGR03299 family)
MAHQVESMMYTGQVPWHGLGKFLNAPPTIAAGIAAAGLDWSVALEPLQLAAPDGRKVDHFATVRQSDRSILGVVGPHYRPLQNAESFAWFQPFLDSGELELHTAGSLQAGRKVWVLAKFVRPGMEIAEGDTVKKYLLLSNSHDGTQSVRVGFTPIRVVCANTLSLAHRDNASQLLRVAHTKSVKVTLDQIRDVVNTANQCFEATAEQYRKLARAKINRTDLRRYIRKVFDVAEDEKVSTRQQNIFDTIERYFDTGRGAKIPSIKGTAWVAYNAVNEYLAYEAGRNQDSRLNALWFGAGAQTDRRALELAIQLSA